ncbi:MAG: hypothetical protein ACLSHO_02310 [Dysosmobacter sp.]
MMENGVDMPRGRVSEEAIAAATADYDLPEGVPVFLFVGRMMWYKGLRIILDALKLLQAGVRISAWCSSAAALTRRRCRSTQSPWAASASLPGLSPAGDAAGVVLPGGSVPVSLQL